TGPQAAPPRGGAGGAGGEREAGVLRQALPPSVEERRCRHHLASSSNAFTAKIGDGGGGDPPVALCAERVGRLGLPRQLGLLHPLAGRQAQVVRDQGGEVASLEVRSRCVYGCLPGIDHLGLPGSGDLAAFAVVVVNPLLVCPRLAGRLAAVGRRRLPAAAQT